MLPKAFVPLNSLSGSQRPAACPEPKGEGTTDQPPIYVSDIFAHTELLAAPVFDAANERTRPNLKVQDGCDNRCSFCVIPSVRGQSRSLPLARVLDEVNTLVAAGYREVVLSGINLGRWGRDLGTCTSDLRGSRPRHSRPDRSRKTPHQLRRTHGLERRTHPTHGRFSSHRQARARPHAVGK